MAPGVDAGMWGRPTYLDRDAGLPDMGANGMGPRAVGHDDADAIHACADPVALGEMKAYAASYVGVGGMVVGSIAATAALAATGRRTGAAWAALSAAVASMSVLETRRRARQWQAVIDARLVTVARD